MEDTEYQMISSIQLVGPCVPVPFFLNFPISVPNPPNSFTTEITDDGNKKSAHARRQEHNTLTVNVSIGSGPLRTPSDEEVVAAIQGLRLHTPDLGRAKALVQIKETRK
jgi:hypothetical protein